MFDSGARIIVRLSGTGSQGATIRLYVDSFEQDKLRVHSPASQTLKSLIAIALELTQITKFTGRLEPTVIT